MFGQIALRGYGFGKQSPYFALQQKSNTAFTIDTMAKMADGTYLASTTAAYVINFTNTFTPVSTYTTYPRLQFVKTSGSLACACSNSLQPCTFPNAALTDATITQKANATVNTFWDSAIDASGNLYGLGLDGTSFYIIKYNSSLVIQWQKRFASSNPYNLGTININNAGEVIIQVLSVVSTYTRTLVMKIASATGAITWQRENYYIGTIPSGTLPTGMIIDSSDNIYSISQVQYDGSGTQIASPMIVKYNTSGTVLASTIITTAFGVNLYDTGYRYATDGTYLYLTLSGVLSGFSTSTFTKVALSNLVVSAFKELSFSGYAAIGQSAFYADGSVYMIARANTDTGSSTIINMSYGGSVIPSQSVANYTLPKYTLPNATTTLTIGDFSYIQTTSGITFATPAYVFTTPAYTDTSSNWNPAAATNYQFFPKVQLGGA
jgi:hypothetical protein